MNLPLTDASRARTDSPAAAGGLVTKTKVNHDEDENGRQQRTAAGESNGCPSAAGTGALRCAPVGSGGAAIAAPVRQPPHPPDRAGEAAPRTRRRPLRAAGEAVGSGTGSKKLFDLARYSVETAAGTFTVRVGDAVVETATLENDDANQVTRIRFADAPARDATITADYRIQAPAPEPAPAPAPVLCTHFSEFKKHFGDFSADDP